jgi:esterase/lipase superfamily enzyme
MQGTRTTVYAASSDVALRASKVVHGYRRVGETSGGVFTYPGLETVDATSASTYSKNLGHSYIVDSSSVLKDIRTIIHDRFSAERRGLNARGVIAKRPLAAAVKRQTSAKLTASLKS